MHPQLHIHTGKFCVALYCLACLAANACVHAGCMLDCFVLAIATSDTNPTFKLCAGAAAGSRHITLSYYHLSYWKSATATLMHTLAYNTTINNNSKNMNHAVRVHTTSCKHCSALLCHTCCIELLLAVVHSHVYNLYNWPHQRTAVITYLKCTMYMITFDQ
jgi:hypothetical protein